MNHAVRQNRLSVLAVLSAMAVVVLDTGSINVALPVMGNALRVSPAAAVFAVSMYQTALIMGLLPSAHIAERFGNRRVFKVGLVLFGVGSIACSLADTMATMVVGRAIQGIGGAAIMALGIALLRLALGQALLGKAIAWNAMTVAACSAAAPVAGAVIVALLPWQWLFIAKLPLVLIALCAATGLPEQTPRQGAVDGPSIAMHAAIAGLVLGAAQFAIPRPALAVLCLVGAVLVARTLLRRQRASSIPLWPLDLLALRPIRVSAIASVCCFCGQSVGLLALPYCLQLSLGQGPIQSGLVLVCWPLAVGATSALANRFAERYGSALPCVVGGALLCISLMLPAVWQVRESLLPLVIAAVLGGVGFGMFQVPNNRTLFLTAPAHRSAAAGGVQGSARLVGQTLGVLVVGVLLAVAPVAAAVRIAFGIGSGFAALAALVSAFEVPLLSRRILSTRSAALSDGGKGEGT